jgi:hypothetical protein
MSRPFQLAVTAVLLGFSRVDLLACTACFGQSDSAMARGMNMGIATLLLVITCVLVSIAGFFVYLIRRSSQLAEAHQQIAPDFSEHRTNF